jgi:hypothetical protein
MPSQAPSAAAGFSRRDFILRSAGAAAAACLWPWKTFSADAPAGGGSFDFIAVNDLHFTDPKLCPPWFEKVFAAMRASAPAAEFMIVSGDLTQDCTAEQFGGMRALFPLLKMPVRVTPGNHDVTENGGRRDLYEQHFPGTTNYAFEHRGWQFFSLNSVESRAAENTKIPADTLAWLDDNLKKADRARPTVISTHYPLGAGMIRRPKNADALLDRFRGFNVRHIFNGHWHGYSEMLVRDATVTTDRCCSRFRDNHDGSPLKGWFVCTAQQEKITRRFVTVPPGLPGGPAA